MNSFGRIYRIHIFGESHGVNVGVVIDGCPAGIPLTEPDLEEDLDRRRAGAEGTTPRRESDIPKIVSGTYKGMTTGAPITVLFENLNTRSEDYDKLKQHPRPGHADYAAMVKFDNHNDPRGGGHFSARITLGLVVAGTIAKKIMGNVQIHAKVKEVGGNKDIDAALKTAIEAKDSVGGLIECICTNLPIGLGEPFFDSVESTIAHLAFSIPAVKGIEFGSGFEAARMYGSQHNDVFIDEAGTTATNNAGGVNGGLTNGNDLVFKVAIKPASSINLPQHTYNLEHKKVEELIIGGRHDVCVALRAPVIVESIAAIALADFMLLEK